MAAAATAPAITARLIAGPFRCRSYSTRRAVILAQERATNKLVYGTRVYAERSRCRIAGSMFFNPF
jgi:hypothetical protein